MRILLMIYTLLVSLSFAQERDFMDHDERGDDEHDRRKRMETMMVWRLTEELDLKPEQAEKFFPRFREHRKNLDAINQEEKEIGKSLRQNIEKDEKLSKSEVTSAVKKITKLRKKKADVEEKFLLGMDDLLDPLQMTILGMFKQKMLREMGGELRKRGDERRNKKKKMRKRRGGHRKRDFWY